MVIDESYDGCDGERKRIEEREMKDSVLNGVEIWLGNVYWRGRDAVNRSGKYVCLGKAQVLLTECD